MGRKSSNQLELYAFVLALGVLGLAEILREYAVALLDENSFWVAHTRQVIAALDDLTQNLADAESAGRGFALTGDEALLDRESQDATEVAGAMRHLTVLVVDNPAQAARVAELRPLVDARLAALARAEDRRREGFDFDTEVAATKEGYERMTKVRAFAADMLAAEAQLLAARERTSHERVREIRFGQGFGTVFSIVVLLAALIRLQRESTRRRLEEERLATTLHSIGDGVIAVDDKARVTRMNRAAEQLTGWNAAEALGKPAAEVFHVVHARTGDALADPLTRAMEQNDEVTFDGDSMLVARDGKKVAIAESAAPITEGGDRATGAVLVFRDISKAKAASDEAHRANAFLDSIIENLPNMVFVKDGSDLAFLRMNKAGEELLGLRREELLGKTDFAFFPAEEARAFVEKDRETLRANKVLDIPEERISTASGLRWLHTKKVPVLDADGEPAFLLGISEDITARRRADIALRDAKAQSDAANKELEAFSYSVAHDLRAPLRSIDGFSLALVEDCAGKLDAEANDYLQRIRRAARRMGELIDDLLALSRVSRTDLVRADIDFSDIASAIGREARQARNPAAELVVQPDIRADADSRLLRVVLDNLLSNAFKFSAPRGKDARVEIAAAPSDGGTVYEVKDNGAGFDVGAATQLFAPFQRYHKPSEFEGTGVGLATVQRIIHRHGGKIWPESKIGSGTTFYFTLGSGDAT